MVPQSSLEIVPLPMSPRAVLEGVLEVDGKAEGAAIPSAPGQFGSASLALVPALVTCTDMLHTVAPAVPSCFPASAEQSPSQEETDNGKTTCLAQAAMPPTPELAVAVRSCSCQGERGPEGLSCVSSSTRHH